MTKPAIIAIGSFSEKTQVALRERFDLHHFGSQSNIPEALDEAARSAIVAIGAEPRHDISARTMDLLPNLKIISVCGMGTEAIDLDAARERGIEVAITTDILGDEVADLAIGLMIASARQIVHADRYVREGKWLSGSIGLGRSVVFKTMGVVGLGGIGRAIADRGAAMKMQVLYNGPRKKADAPYEFCADLVDMARRSDYLMVACPGGPATANVISAEVIDALGPEGTLVNVARGSVVDEKAMIAALKNGRLGFAALDVFQNSPNIDRDLLDLPNVIVQPHHGSATVETRFRMGMAMINNILSKVSEAPAPERMH